MWEWDDRESIVPVSTSSSWDSSLNNGGVSLTVDTCDYLCKRLSLMPLEEESVYSLKRWRMGLEMIIRIS